MIKKKKQKQARGIKVFIFMQNLHEMMVLTEGGIRLNLVSVDSEVEAKEIIMSETFNKGIIDKLETTNFSTLWIDDPAGNPEVIEACRLMEEKLKEHVEENEAEATTQPEPNENGEITMHTKGFTFEIKVGSEFNAVMPRDLKVDDVCIFYLEDIDQVEEKPTYRVVAAPVNDGEDGDYIITLKKIDDIKQPIEGSPAGPQFTPTGTTKIIDVECPTTQSEEMIRKLVRNLQSIKSEASASAASYREDIKAAEKRLFDACAGKSYTQMECNVENDWEAGERRYIRPDNGEVAKVEKIPYEEIQLSIGLDDATPAEATTDADEATAQSVPGKDVTEDPEQVGGDPGEEEVAAEADGFPPPEETEEK